MVNPEPGTPAVIITRVREALRFWWTFLAPIVLISAPFALAGEGVQQWLGPALDFSDTGRLTDVTPVSLVSVALIKVCSAGALITLLDSIQEGSFRGFSACVLRGLQVTPVLTVTYGFMLAGVYVGLLMLILPAFWIYARVSLAPFVVTLEGRTPMEAIQASFERTMGPVQWQLLVGLILLALFVFSAINLIAGTGQAWLGEHPALELGLNVLAAVGGALLSVFLFRFYGLTRPADPEAGD